MKSKRVKESENRIETNSEQNSSCCIMELLKILFLFLIIFKSSISVSCIKPPVIVTDICIKCLAEIQITFDKNNPDLDDCNEDGIIGCDDVINQKLYYDQCLANGTTFRDHETFKTFSECCEENDVAYIYTHEGTIKGNIKSMVVVLDTIFALTPTHVYKFDKNSLTELQSSNHDMGEGAFLYLPYPTNKKVRYS